MKNTNELRLKQKASFYFKEKLSCHVIMEPKGFMNGLFLSELTDDTYFLFEDQRTPGESVRLFLCDIFDIKDYEGRE